MSDDKQPPRYYFGVHGTWLRWMRHRQRDREAEEIEKRRGEAKPAKAGENS